MVCVYHIISSLERGGRERQLSLICKHSTQIDNRIIYFRDSDHNYIDEYGLSDIVTKVSENGLIRRFVLIKKILSVNKADSLISWGLPETLLGLCVSLVLKVPMINFSIRHGIRKRKWSHLFRSLLLHMSKYVVANSIAGLRANNLSRGFVLYNGVEDIPILKTPDQKRVRQKERLKISDKIVLVSVANLVPYKDYHSVLQALHNLKKQHIGFYYIIIGEGPNRVVIEKTIKLLGLDKEVLLTGRISNVDYYLDVSDILIHSSLGEGCSNAILEGMKHGLPIIATKVGGTPEIMNDSNSVLFEYGDVDALSGILTKLLSNPEMLTSMGKSSQEIVIKRFTVSKMIHVYERTIRAILSRDISLIDKVIIKAR